MFKRTIYAMTLALAMLAGSPLEAGRFGPPPQAPHPATATYVAPTAEEAADMLFMREEEKLARDVYLTLYDAWGLAPFFKISASEQKHMDAMLLLLRKYQLPDPATGNLIGEFTDLELQKLYDKLIVDGMRARRRRSRSVDSSRKSTWRTSRPPSIGRPSPTSTLSTRS